MHSAFRPGQRIYIVNSANLRRSPGYVNKPTDDCIAVIAPDTPATVLAHYMYADDLIWWKVEINHPYRRHGWIAESSPIDVPLLAAISCADLETQINEQAAAINLDPAIAQAVFQVESGLHATPSPQMVVRLEVHVLFDHISYVTRFNQHFRFGGPTEPHKEHKWRTALQHPWRPLHVNQRSERAAVDFAAKLFPRETVLRAVSMGPGQIMGRHFRHLGYDSASSMYDAWAVDYVTQVQGFFTFLAARGWDDLLRARDWEGFARVYNGAGQVRHYADLLRSALDD